MGLEGARLEGRTSGLGSVLGVLWGLALALSSLLEVDDIAEVLTRPSLLSSAVNDTHSGAVVISADGELSAMLLL